MIEIQGLTKTYGSKTVVDNATWTAPDGAITGFIGPNGSGKTTTLKMITGVEQPTSGRALVNGKDVREDGIAVKKDFAYVSDCPDHFLRMKGIEYLGFMANVYDIEAAGREEKIAEMAQRFGMTDALNSTILSYSHGMRQKIMVMGALIHNPSVWILDEPMLGLDPQSSFELKKMMREHADAGNSVLFSTHVLEVAEKLCDHVVIIAKGGIRFAGKLEELEAQYPGKALEDIFLAVTGDTAHE